MKDQMKWGFTAVLAVAAAVGISSQSGSKPGDALGTTHPAQVLSPQSKGATNGSWSPCGDLIDLFHAFLPDDNWAASDVCHQHGPQTNAVKATEFKPKFIIATLPDPLHTHFSLLFDRFVEAIQQGAQDEGYEYDSSWLPWETEESPFALLPDQDTSDDRKKAREDQPGVIVFRGTKEASYQHALIVFVVGEESTHGIHRQQFENAVKWIVSLQGGNGNARVGILGPTFSGSFPSLAELLSPFETFGDQLPIYSGSANNKQDAEQFAGDPAIVFRSFIQDDETALSRFCRYLQEEGESDNRRIAILSEDETAYGRTESSQGERCKGATWLYYPRDISTLRAAYQEKSLFSSGSSQPAQGTPQQKDLPTDLADPKGKEHDTVRTYAGDQTPLSQEAELLAIVAALRSHRAHYIVLRSSNTLDPLFLTNFLRRQYPEGRIVVLNSDLLYQRGQDALQLSGAMTLSTYPLFPIERDWTARQPIPYRSHRVFPENSTEGTYIAARLLLRSLLSGDPKGQKIPTDAPVSKGCQISSDAGDQVFVPPISCDLNDKEYVPIPDYTPPFWTETAPCDEGGRGDACRPVTWLSVITNHGSWPLAAINDQTLRKPDPNHRDEPSAPQTAKASEYEGQPIPLSMKLFLVALLGFSLFHAWCCHRPSLTARPAFRAHFATDNAYHRELIFAGSLLIAQLALFAGWGNGIFAWKESPPPSLWLIRFLVLFIWICTGFSFLTNVRATQRLSGSKPTPIKGSQSDERFRNHLIILGILFGLSIVLSYTAWVFPIDSELILANRVPAYWRSMNLASGVSPLVPFLLLISGLYIWFWYALHGLALFGPDRPRLPLREQLTIAIPPDEKQDEGHDKGNGSIGGDAKAQELNVLPMFSYEFAQQPAEDIAAPLVKVVLKLNVCLFFIFLGLVFVIAGGVPVRSLGVTRYALVFCLWLDFCFCLILGGSWQLWSTWCRLRQLLVFLDRMPLRRTLGALSGFSWGSVWKMSGNVLDVRYKLLSRQLECLNHLHTSLQKLINAPPPLPANALTNARDCLATVDATRIAGISFAKWYSLSYRDPEAAGLQCFEHFQECIAATSGQVLTKILIPEWRTEEHSLILTQDAGDEKDDDKNQRKNCPPTSKKEHIRNAEELVCLTYLGFVQNMLGRIRTMALGTIFLFVSVTLSVSNYPFDPRPALSGVLFLLFVMFGGVIVFVYADMHRDATLSHITNTNPGELGSEFWFKIIGFGAAPLLGLITTIFPDLSGFLFSWLEPGLASLK